MVGEGIYDVYIVIDKWYLIGWKNMSKVFLLFYFCIGCFNNLMNLKS